MKTFAATAAIIGAASAFPAINTYGTEKRALAPVQGAGALPLLPPQFDPKTQYVETTGAHAWVAPTSSDARGECPGLNALANHGYLPHNGQATIQQFIDATYDGVGMARDLGGFLALYGAIVDGDGAGWSIEGGPHVGIGGSHHDYEADSSPLKSDLNQYGSNERLIMSQFKTLYDMQPDPKTANYNLEVMRAFRGKRFQESVSKNPYFFYGPFDGIEVSQAAFTFIYRFMSNKSAENPEGVLNKADLKSWMAISGPENNLTWTKGYERIPTPFYKRNPADSYSIPYFEADILYFAETVPEVISIGCNKGKVNTYSTFSPESLTAGAATAASVLANPFCYGLGLLETGGQAFLGLSDAQEAQLKQGLAAAAKAGNCPLNNITTTSFTQFKDCPGFSLYGGPTGPVAPGAIQS